MHYITAVRFRGGETESLITSVRWLNVSDGVAGTSNVAAMVEWLDKGNVVFVGSPSGKIRVGVVRPKGKPPYLRAYANKEWVDNLCELPRF